MDELSGNIIAELMKRLIFGGFIKERMQLLLEGIWDKVEYDLKDSKISAGQMEECSDSKAMQSVFNGRTLNTIFGYVGFICFLNTIHLLTAFV